MGKFDKKYSLYSRITADLTDDFTINHVERFLARVMQVSQNTCPVITGRLKHGWDREDLIYNDRRVDIIFGYYVKDPETGAEYAMPVDYFTGGMRQMGFFSGAVRMAFDSMNTEKGGNIGGKMEGENFIKVATVRGINDGEKITLPGRYG